MKRNSFQITILIFCSVFLWNCSDSSKIENGKDKMDSLIISLKNINFKLGEKHSKTDTKTENAILNEKLSYKNEDCIGTTELAEFPKNDSLSYLKYRYKENRLIGMVVKMSKSEFETANLQIKSKDETFIFLNKLDTANLSSVNFREINISSEPFNMHGQKYFRIEITDTAWLKLNKNNCWGYEWDKR